MSDIFVETIKVKHPEVGEKQIDIWMNSETRKLFISDNLPVDTPSVSEYRWCDKYIKNLPKEKGSWRKSL